VNFNLPFKNKNDDFKNEILNYLLIKSITKPNANENGKTKSNCLLNMNNELELIKYVRVKLLEEKLNSLFFRIKTFANEEDLNKENEKANFTKQKRAKRGQYRRYELNQLDRAIEAVLNSSMSVHKAGSQFGIPHSTLEYKVKEKLNGPLSLINDARKIEKLCPATNEQDDFILNFYDI
jgi:hypothetical protein